MQLYNQRFFTIQKKNIYRLAVIVFIFVMLQTAILGKITFWGLKPELLLVLCCYFSLNLTDRVALVAALILGLINDAYSMAPFGLTSLSFLVITTILLKARNELMETNLSTWCAVVGAATLFNGMFHVVALRLVLWEPLPVLDFMGKLLVLLLINVLFGALLLPLLSRVSSFRKNPSRAKDKDQASGLGLDKFV